MNESEVDMSGDSIFMLVEEEQAKASTLFTGR
jgi:hypothetical protein